jgi:LEA14-like dessication related protein
VAFTGGIGLAACASAPIRPPTLQVAGLRVGDLGLTGVALDVRFRLRNPNEKAIRIERFEYDLEVNGHRLGRGFETHAIRVDAFQEEEIVSRFDLNLLSLPAAVRTILGEREIAAHVEGLFFIKGQEPMPFASGARIDLAR